MNFLKYDSPFMKKLNMIVDYFLLGLLWLVTSIPVITFGAATTAAFFTAEKSIHKENGKMLSTFRKTSVYKGYKQDKIEMRGDRAEMSDFPLYLNTVAGGLDRRDQTIGGFSFVVKIYAVPVVEIIG